MNFNFKALNDRVKKLDRKMLVIIAVSIVVLSVLFLAMLISNRDTQKTDVVSADYTENDVVSSAAGLEQNREILLVDDRLTDKNYEYGRQWVHFDKAADLVTDSFSFMPDGKYAHRLKYSIAAGGKFVNQVGAYSVPEVGVLYLYPNIGDAIVYSYKIENDCLYLRKDGEQKWSYPYEMAESN